MNDYRIYVYIPLYLLYMMFWVEWETLRHSFTVNFEWTEAWTFLGDMATGTQNLRGPTTRRQRLTEWALEGGTLWKESSRPCIIRQAPVMPKIQEQIKCICTNWINPVDRVTNLNCICISMRLVNKRLGIFHLIHMYNIRFTIKNNLFVYPWFKTLHDGDICTGHKSLTNNMYQYFGVGTWINYALWQQRLASSDNEA